MIRFSDRLQALPGYPLAEIPSIKRRLIEAGMDVIDLGAGDNDTPPPDSRARGDARGAQAAGAEQVRVPAGADGLSPGGVALGGAPLRHSLRSGHRDAAAARLQGRALAPAADGGEPGRRGAGAGAGLPGLHRRRDPVGRGAAHLPAPGRSQLPARARRRAGRRAQACQAGLRQLSQQPDGRGREHRVPHAAGEQLPQARHPARLRQRLLRAHVRRLSGAEHLRDPGRARRGHRVLLALQELLDDRLAHRLRRGTERADRRADAGQVVRRHRAVARDPAGRGGGAGQLRCAGGAGARRARAPARCRRGGAQRERDRLRGAACGDVPLGAAARRASRPRPSRGGCSRKPASCCFPAAASARRARATSGSRSRSALRGWKRRHGASRRCSRRRRATNSPRRAER